MAFEQVAQLRGMANLQGASTVGIYLDETPLALDIQGDSISVRLLDMVVSRAPLCPSDIFDQSDHGL